MRRAARTLQTAGKTAGRTAVAPAGPAALTAPLVSRCCRRTPTGWNAAVGSHGCAVGAALVGDCAEVDVRQLVVELGRAGEPQRDCGFEVGRAQRRHLQGLLF